MKWRDFPDGPTLRILCSHCQGPWVSWGTKTPQTLKLCAAKIKKEEEEKERKVKMEWSDQKKCKNYNSKAKSREERDLGPLCGMLVRSESHYNQML